MTAMVRRAICALVGLSLFPAFAQALTPDALALKSELEKRAIRYFIENANPTTGLVRDRALNFQPTPDSNVVASIAGTGFGLIVLANAAERGLIDRQVASEFALKVLRFSRDHVARYHGFFLHFINWETGERMWNSEYSTIDTALFMAGALYAAQTFPKSEISRLADELYSDLDFFDMMTDGGKFPDRRTISLRYAPEDGYSHWQWERYAEQMILLVLGLGHPEHPLPEEAWTAWSRRLGLCPENTNLMGADMPLFVHQYSHLFIDFRNFNDGFPNYFTNSVLATEFNRKVGLQQTGKTFQTGFWGFSAGDAPNSIHYYVFDPTLRHKEIVCLDCVVGSAMFLPDVILDDVGHWLHTEYHDRIWGRYGLADSVDLDSNWFSQEVFAITVGPAYLSLANLDPATSVWSHFMSIPTVQVGLRRAMEAELKEHASLPTTAAP